jgi:hypothetical protein
VSRGGNFVYVASYLLASFRNVAFPTYRDLLDGFRCARTP